MNAHAPFEPARPMVVIVTGDAALAHALTFRIELEGFDVRAGDDARTLLALGLTPRDACLVIDHTPPETDGIRLLAQLRATGLDAPAVLLVTNPTSGLRASAAAANAPLIEKPLLSDALLTAIRGAVVSDLT